MPRGVKTDNRMKAKIMTSYALTNSYNATGKELGISENTVKSIIENNPDEFEKVCEQKKETFLEQANVIIDKALLLLNRRYDKALENEKELDELLSQISNADKEDLSYQERQAIAKKIGKLELNSLSEITTSMGTLYDKMRLASGESTANNSITIKMSEELEELSK